jgi:purine-binding chemotaxis protein CheW
MPSTKKSGRSNSGHKKRKRGGGITGKSTGKKGSRAKNKRKRPATIARSENARTPGINEEMRQPDKISTAPDTGPETGLARREVVPAPEPEKPSLQEAPPEQQIRPLQPAADGRLKTGVKARDGAEESQGQARSRETDTDVSRAALQLVCFKLGDEEYGVDIHDVQEIIRVPDLGSALDASSGVKGAMSWRGKVIQTIDLRRLLGLPEAADTGKTRIIVFEREGIPAGLLVDDVTQVLRIQQSQIVKTPELASITGQRYLKGIYQQDGRLILIIDTDGIGHFETR